MFNATIQNTSLNGDIADMVFPNINAPSYNGDYSMIATMRFLLCSRLPEGVKVGADFNRVPCNHYELESYGMNFNRFFMQVSPLCSNSLLFLTCSGSTTDVKLGIKAFDNEFIGWAKEKGEEFRELADLREYTKTKMGHEARFFICDNEKATVIVSSAMDMKILHFYQSFLPRLMPWWFEDKPLTGNEIMLLKGLQQKYPTIYINAIEKFASTLDFRSVKIRNMLGGFESRYKEAELTSAQESLKSVESDIKLNLQRYSNLIAERETRSYKVQALELRMKQNNGQESELIDFCLRNKSVEPVRVRGREMILIIKDYLDMVDPEMYETISKNWDSHLYRDYSRKAVFADQEDRKVLLDALFSSEAQLKVLGCAVYILDVSGDVSCYQQYDYPEDCADRIANPHIQYYSCLGDYSRLIRENLLNGDLIGTVQQCIASCKSMNIGEGCTMRHFLTELFTTDKKCIELPDGRNVTPEDALNWLQNN